MKIKRAIQIAISCLPYLLSLPVYSRADAAPSGRICVAPLDENARARDHDMPGGKPQRREPMYDFFVQIGDGEKVAIPKDNKPVLIEGLTLSKAHKVRIFDGKEMIESFQFTFEKRGGSTLCLTYGSWYQTWTLEPPRPGARWCKCDLDRK